MLPSNEASRISVNAEFESMTNTPEFKHAVDVIENNIKKTAHAGDFSCSGSGEELGILKRNAKTVHLITAIKSYMKSFGYDFYFYDDDYDGMRYECSWGNE